MSSGVARPVTATAAGGVVVVCAIVAAFAAAVPGRLSRGGGPQFEWNYPLGLWPMLGALGVAGVLLAARPGLRRPAAAVSAILAAQAAGHGIVAVRDWFNQAGASGGMGLGSLALVVGFAAVVALTATIGGCVSVALLWREPANGWRGVRPARPAYVVVGAAVAVLLPVAVAVAFRHPAATLLGQIALTYSLPWGVGTALAGWLGRRGRVAACVTVAASVVLVATEFAVVRPA